ncbi:MAG TPA: hypothetical protein VLG49_08500 [Rhabdochlamydiaceae bacterium]|nr:hypothetical protein [Rhabdochlamydiaceae bacterium]
MTFLNISNSCNSITERKHETRSFRRVDSGLRDKVLKAAVTEFGARSKDTRQSKINELRSRKSVPILTKSMETLPTDCPARGLIKSFIRALREWKFERASIIYQLMAPEDRQQIAEYVYQRSQLLPFIRPIRNIEEARELIHFYCDLLRDDYQWAEGIHFFKEFLLPAAQEHLIQNYEYEKHSALIKEAEDARAFVKNENLLSSNFPNRDDKLLNVDIEDEDMFIEFSEKCKKIGQDLTSLRTLTDKFDIEQPKKNQFLQTSSSAHFSKSHSRGNCDEMSALAFDFLKRRGKKADLFGLYNGDHKIVFLNRRKNSHNSRDWTDMGPHCIVLEVWGDKKNIYSAHDIPIYLEDYKQLDFLTGKPITERFNPQTQDLRFDISSLYSANDFHALVDPRYDTDVLKWFECQLIAFQNTQDSAQRLMIAHEIINYRYETDGVLHPKNQQVVKNLVSQMKTFLDPEYGRIYDLTPKNSKKQLDPSNMELEVDIDALDHHLSDVMLEHMMDIADVFKHGETELGLKKFQKLTDRVQNEVYNFINFLAKTNGLTWIKEDFGYLAFNHIGNCNIGDDMRAKAINMWLADKLALAFINDKNDEMNKMIDRLSPDALIEFKFYVEKALAEQSTKSS